MSPTPVTSMGTRAPTIAPFAHSGRELQRPIWHKSTTLLVRCQVQVPREIQIVPRPARARDSAKISRSMTTKEEWKAKNARLERARIKAEGFVAAGGDLKSEEAVPLAMELIKAFNEVSTLFGHPILAPLNKGQTPRGPPKKT
jgi:hypothetical protein